MILNWKLVSHPMNWLTIILMLVIAATFGHYLLSYFEVEPSGDQSSYSQIPAGYSPQTANGAGSLQQ